MLGTIHSIVGLATIDANRQAKHLSLTMPGVIMGIVTMDRSGAILAWASTEQKLAAGEHETSRWENGKEIVKL